MAHVPPLLRASLTLLLVAGAGRASEGLRPLPAATLGRLKSDAPRRVQTLHDHLVSRGPEWGLPFGSGFQLLSQDTDQFGVTHGRFQQTHLGLKVWGGRALAHLGPEGGLLPVEESLKRGVDVGVVPELPAAEALELAREALPVQGRFLRPPRTELVILPREAADGLKFRRDQREGTLRLDEDYSVPNEAPAAPYVLAYHVASQVLVPRQGLRAFHCILDARTGALLKRWDGLEYAETPAVGSGKSQYSGTVSLNTNRLNGGSYELRDRTRATSEHPLAGDLPALGGIGSQTLFFDEEGNPTPFLDADDAWGDGRNFENPGVPDSPNGQTAAADAHYGLQVTWDYYKNLHGRNGIDDFGTSAVSFVHVLDDFGDRWDNASWNNDVFVMSYGDGTTSTSLTCLDIAGHEMSHGVMAATAGLVYADESGGLNESNSDINGTMVEFYGRGGGSGAAVPDSGGNWTLGEQITSPFLRSMIQPSQDGLSYDHWFEGVGIDDVHYSSGPGNRFFYFLSVGTGNSADKKSPYLPGGMAGIGNTKASKIWYRALTRYVADPTSTYDAMRVAVLKAAKDLHGEGSAEYQAVQNAYAAVNVGPAAGAPAPVRVSLGLNPGNPAFLGDRIKVVGAGLDAQMEATAANAANPGLAWSLGGLSIFYPSGGRITADGLFTAPIRGGGTTYPVMATSLQSPLQYAVGIVYVANLDADDDTEMDACDMGALALSYGLSQPILPGADLTGNGVVNDNDVAVFVQAFRNAFGR